MFYSYLLILLVLPE